MVQIAEGRGGELEGAEADVVQRLIVDEERLVRVLDKLMDREHTIVWLNDRVGHLGRREDRVGAHDTIRVLFTNLGDEKGSHAGASATAKRVREGEALEAVAALSLLADNIEYRINELSTFSVMALSPVVAGARLTEDEVIRAEDLAEGTRADGVHGARLEVHKDGARDVAATSRLIVVDVDALELQIRITMVGAGRVNAVLIGYNLPEFGADLVTALATLDGDDLTHG
mmetsp:Transcript_50734/g.69608  ORF Transcript_50734/g.69608 Transcript_50734/m.69608 type:complete len:229 (+) Transcript_50734:847-1533(+)